MTPEQRFDRLERIVMLMIKAGLRARSQIREQAERIDMIMALQIQNEEKFGRNDESFAKLAEAQAHTDQRLDALINIVHGNLNDRSSGPT